MMLDAHIIAYWQNKYAIGCGYKPLRREFVERATPRDQNVSHDSACVRTPKTGQLAKWQPII